MLFNGSTTISNLDFKNKIKIKIISSIIIMILGAISLAFALYTSGNPAHSASFLNGFYTGLGSAFIFAGGITLFKATKTLKSQEQFNKAKIAYEDERNKFILNKTLSITAYIMYSILFVALVFSGLFNITVFMTILVILGITGVITVLTATIISKRY